MTAPAPVIARQQRIACPACVPQGLNGVLYERLVTNARGLERLIWCNVCAYGYAIPLPAAQHRRAATVGLVWKLLRDPVILAMLLLIAMSAAAYALAAPR